MKDLVNELKKINNIVTKEKAIDSNNFSVDFLEAEVINLVYNYCIDKGYSYEGFPIKYKLEFEDEDFLDFLTHDVKTLFIYKLAKSNTTVFELLKVIDEPYIENNETDEERLKSINNHIEYLEENGTSLIFDKYNFNPTPVQRPHIP